MRLGWLLASLEVLDGVRERGFCNGKEYHYEGSDSQGNSAARARFCTRAKALIGRTPRGSCSRTRLLERFLEGYLKEVLLRRVLRRRLVRVSIERRRFLEGFLEGGCVNRRR